MELVTDKTAYAAGDTVVAALHVTVPDGYHLYANPLGPGIGKPAHVRASVNGSIQWLTLKKTKPVKFTPQFGGWVWAYSKEACFFLTGVIAKTPPPAISFSLAFGGLVCKNACIPISKNITDTLSIGQKGPGAARPSFDSLVAVFNALEPMEFDTGPDSAEAKEPLDILGQIKFSNDLNNNEMQGQVWDYEPLENKPALNLLLAILLGFLAGIILNVMPCVLPVLGIKILSFASLQGVSRRFALVRSLAFSGGMLLVFMVLASLAAAAHLSWGEQFQSPWFLVGLITLIIVFSLGLFDVYLIYVPFGVSVPVRKKGHGLLADFLQGMFATVLSTPCSGPFLGATLAWTLTQPGPVIFLVFFSIGTGMAFPYVLFSASATMQKMIPRPGPWMNAFKFGMGVVLLLAGTYLFLGLPSDMMGGTAVFCCAVTAAVFTYVKLAPLGSAVPRKAAGVLVAVAVMAAGYFIGFHVLFKPATEDRASASVEKVLDWEGYSPNILTDAHVRRENVIVDFTANWCLNCQYNTIAVLTSKQVEDLITEKHVVALKADMSRSNPEAENLLHRLGSKSIPFLAVFPGHDPRHPVIMRDILSRGELIRVLKDLK